jgi:hypothetical protein
LLVLNCIGNFGCSELSSRLARGLSRTILSRASRGSIFRSLRRRPLALGERCFLRRVADGVKGRVPRRHPLRLGRPECRERGPRDADTPVMIRLRITFALSIFGTRACAAPSVVVDRGSQRGRQFRGALTILRELAPGDGDSPRGSTLLRDFVLALDSHGRPVAHPSQCCIFASPFHPHRLPGAHPSLEFDAMFASNEESRAHPRLAQPANARCSSRLNAECLHGGSPLPPALVAAWEISWRVFPLCGHLFFPLPETFPRPSLPLPSRNQTPPGAALGARQSAVLLVRPRRKRAFGEGLRDVGNG